MNLPSARRTTFLVLAALAAAACGDRNDHPLAPPVDDVRGTYVLESVNGTPLPYLVVDDGELLVRVLADTIVLGADGAGHWDTHFEWQVNGGPLSPFVLELPVTYRRVGGELRLQTHVPCPPEMHCEPEAERAFAIADGSFDLEVRFGTHRFARRD
jgi:hypothetical protein